MRTRIACLATALALLLAAPPARVEDPRLLGYASFENTPGSNYGGLGAMWAAKGLDHDGILATAEIGRSFDGARRIGLMSGWRMVRQVFGGGLYATALAGIDAGEAHYGAASLDLWWNNALWMVAGRSQLLFGSDDNTRIAGGYRVFGARFPWIGPEISHTWEGPRFGLHATGLRLPAAVEARISAGQVMPSERDIDGGSYFEISLWRRF